MKQFLLVVLLEMLSLHVLAQNNQLVVTDETDAPTEFVNVACLSSVDSTLLFGGVTDVKGNYEYEKVKAPAILRISMVGYQTLFFDQPFPKQIKLIPASLKLGEVEVKAYRKNVKITNRGLIVDVDKTPLAQLPTIEDAIRQMPLINQVDGTVLGKGTPEIYINSRKVRNTDELKQLSPLRVLSVEIINKPGVKYGAEVSSVIIIKTKKGEHELAGVLTGNGAVSEVLTENINADISYMFRNGMGIYTGMGFSNDGFKQKREYVEIFNQAKSKTVTNGTYESHSKMFNANFGLSYDFDLGNSMGIRYEFERTPKSHYEANSNIDLTSEDVNETLFSQTVSKKQSFLHSMNFYSNVKFGQHKSFEWKTSADYLYGVNKRGSATIEEGENIHDDVNTSSHSNFHLVAVKSNLAVELGNLSADFGIQYSGTRNNMSFTSNGNAMAAALSSATDAEKQVGYASYLELEYSIGGKWTVSGGLRFEGVDFNYTKNGVRIDEQSKTFLNWLPDVGVNYKNDNAEVDLAYYTKITRPSYSMLNSNYFYISHTSWEAGNPLLKYALIQTLDLTMSYKQSYFEVLLKRNKRNINTVYTYLETDNINVRQEINLSTYNSLTLIASQRFSVGFWHPMLQGVAYFQHFKYGTPEKSYDKPLGKFSFDNRFNLLGNFFLYLGASWLTCGHQATLYLKNFSSYYLRLTKVIKNWSFNLLFNDFAKTYRNKNLVDTNGVSYYENRNGASHLIRLSVTYAFNGKKSYKGKKSVPDEINRLR